MALAKASTRKLTLSSHPSFSIYKILLLHLQDSFTDAIMASNLTSDPFSQSFILLLGDGTPFNVTIPDLDAFVLYNVEICINYAAQLGASLVILILLALLTKTDKRKSPIFVLNALSLAFNVVRNVLQCLYFTGPFSETYAYFAQDYSRVPASAYAISITATVFTVLLLMSIEISLLLQVQVVCVTLRYVYRRIVLVLSINIALVAIGFRLAQCILNSEATVYLTDLYPLVWLFSATNITTTISICWFCAVFTTKLGFALHQRRKLGLRRFGPMDIIFIVGCQTLVIPGKSIQSTNEELPAKSLLVIFSILQYTTDLPSMDSNVLTLVAIFLPLSAIWASASVDSNTQPPVPAAGRLKFFTTSKSTGHYTEKKSLSGAMSSTTGTSTRISASPLSSPKYEDFNECDIDLEAQGMTGPRITHAFAVSNTPRGTHHG